MFKVIQLHKLLFLIIIFHFTSCTKKDEAVISMKFDQVPAPFQAYLLQRNIYKNDTVDSIRIASAKTIKWKPNLHNTNLYSLVLNDSCSFSLILSTGDKLRLYADLKAFYQTKQIENSAPSILADSIHNQLVSLKHKLINLEQIYLSYLENEVDIQDEITDSVITLIKAYKKYAIGFILENLNSLASIEALCQELEPGNYIFNQSRDLQYFGLAADSLQKIYPQNPQVTNFVINTHKMINNYHTARIMNTAKSTYLNIPNIQLPGINGDTLSLFEIKKPVTLLTFWGSWEEPCIENNIALKNIYATYADKGFEIFQVSFDKNEERWKRYIRIDELNWIHVIDTNLPQSAVAGIYNVQKLPLNYLIDSNRDSILAVDLSPEELDKKLGEILN